MKLIKGLLLLIGLSSFAAAGPVGPPGGSPILNQSWLQTGATFYVPNGVVSNSLRLLYLSPGLCTTTNVQGKVVNIPCGGSGAPSPLGVNQDGVPVTTPTYALNGVWPIVVTPVSDGATAQLSLDPSSVTLKGQNVVLLSNVLIPGTTIYLSSGTILTLVTSSLTATAALFPNGLTSNGLISNTGQLQNYGTATFFGNVLSPNYGYTMPDGSVMTSTTNFVWNSGIPQSAEANISSITVRTEASFPFLTPGQCATTDSEGKLINTSCGSGISMLAVSSGSATNSVIVSSPTGNIVVDSHTFILSLQGTTTTFIGVNPSSVTLQGNSISLSEMKVNIDTTSAFVGNLSVSTSAIQSDLDTAESNIAALGVSTTSLQTQINGKGVGTVTGVIAGTGLTGGGYSGNVTLNVVASSFSGLSDVNDSGKAVNLVPKWNGSQIVWAAYNATFSFSVASFTDSIASTVLIGTGTWKSTGTITFTATYTNGPSTGAYVSKSGWSNLAMTGAGYVGPTASAASVAYPSVAGTVVFTLNAGKGSETDTETITHTFYNYRFWGVSTVSGSYSEGHVEGLANSEISNAVAKTFTLSPGADEYILYAYPSRLGSATFTVGGFEGGFQSPETVSVTNPSGYQENYYVYRSTNKNLGSTTVTVN